MGFNGKIISFNEPQPKIINDIFRFIKEYEMQEFCILDVIKEYCFKKNIDEVQFCIYLAEYEGFKELVEKDLIRFKFSNKNNLEKEKKDLINEWE